jgi:tRNA (adenine37-N6)-methyltransferase
MTFAIEPVAFVRGGRAEAVDDDWDSETAVIELAPGFTADAIAGLADFSHVEVAFVFDRVPPEKIETGARHPRNRQDWPLVGIFAQRGKNRPNRIGITICRIEKVAGTRIHVRGLDAIDGTPVIDIKPVMREFLPRGDIHQPEWSSDLMAGYWVA